MLRKTYKEDWTICFPGGWDAYRFRSSRAQQDAKKTLVEETSRDIRRYYDNIRSDENRHLLCERAIP